MVKKCETPELNERTLAFLINGGINISIYDLCRYIASNYKTVDCYDIRKNFTNLALNGCDIEDILYSYLKDTITNIEDYTDDEYDYDHLIKTNLDVFFDITEKENDVVTVELASCN